ncbi:unnamed protein product [Schistosoma turkestanicum]|nr:unnamed protein product [Schistosoma turkestanicum]
MSIPKPHICISFRKSNNPRLNDSIRAMRNRGLLNTSRRLLQKSINQSFSSVTSLRANNASLAKKLAKLEVELNDQKMATEQAKLELFDCRMKVIQSQAFKEVRDQIKALILNLHELLCSQMETGMSMMNYVKDSLSLLEKNDSLNLSSNPHLSSRLDETIHPNIIMESIREKDVQQSHTPVNKSPVPNPEIVDQRVSPDPVSSSCCINENKEDVINIVDHTDHKTQLARPHLVRQARLNSKPIIDTSSFMDSFIVEKPIKQKKKPVRNRLIRVRDSDDESEVDDVNNKGNPLKDNVNVGGGGGGGRVIETCFRRPGELAFRIDSKNINPSSTTIVRDHRVDGKTGRSKSKLPDGQPSRSKSKSQAKPHTTTTTAAVAHTNNNNINSKENKEKNVTELKTLSKLVGGENKVANIFDLSMNRTADLSALPPTLNDLRIKHKEQLQQQRQPVNSNVEAEKQTAIKTTTTTITTRKRSVFGELQQNENLNSAVKSIVDQVVVGEHRRPSVVLTRISNENQPLLDLQLPPNSRNAKRRFRRLYLCDQENEGNNNNCNDHDDDDDKIGATTVSKRIKHKHPTALIDDKIENKNNNNNNLPTTTAASSSRSRKNV